jgi:hypothetical protein
MSLWNILQQAQIQNLKGKVAGNDAELTAATNEARTLGRDANLRLEHLVLLTEAMWELLSERVGITTDELAAKVRQVDARDGRVDGVRGLPPGATLLHCSSCQAAIPPGATKCQFCGAAVPEAKADPFQV